jgi:prevent-host-death family protein
MCYVLSMVLTLPVSKLRQALAEVLNQVGYGAQTVRIERHGRALGYLISPGDFEEYQLLLDHQDRQAIDQAGAAGELDDTVPFRAADYDASFAAEPILRHRVDQD